MVTSVPARSVARSAAGEYLGSLAARILIALAFTLMTAYALVAAQGYLFEVFGPGYLFEVFGSLPDADLVLVLQ